MADEFTDRPIKGEQPSITLVCCAFDVPTSCVYDYLARKRAINRERMQQRCELRRLFKASRDSAGSRAFQQRLWRYRMNQNMSRRCNCWERQRPDGAVVQKS